MRYPIFVCICVPMKEDSLKLIKKHSHGWKPFANGFNMFQLYILSHGSFLNSWNAPWMFREFTNIICLFDSPLAKPKPIGLWFNSLIPGDSIGSIGSARWMRAAATEISVTAWCIWLDDHWCLWAKDGKSMKLKRYANIIANIFLMCL